MEGPWSPERWPGAGSSPPTAASSGTEMSKKQICFESSHVGVLVVALATSLP